uniref:Lipoyl-binding domain-containing protein n=1 Tax=Kalanchoe fedtschenkoi TaxID=63787 RepID=A0A7N0TI84_KALFE
MESAASLRSFHHTVGAVAAPQSVVERPGMLSFCNVASGSNGLISKLLCDPTNHRATVVSCLKTVKASDTSAGSPAMKAPTNPTFPKGFEIGDFQMQLKRNLVPAEVPPPVVSPSAPVAAEPKTVPPSAPPKAPSAKSSAFVNIPKEKSAKLVALESSGTAGYVLVSSPTVGSFHRGRTLKGKKQPPVCKEGDVIKEGQIIGYVDQFGTELPIKSDVAGEVVKLLLDEGDGVGYGDPLIAVLPSFHGIR